MELERVEPTTSLYEPGVNPDIINPDVNKRFVEIQMKVLRDRPEQST